MTDKIEVPRELLEELRDCASYCFHYESTLSYSHSTRVNFYEGLMEQCDALLGNAAKEAMPHDNRVSVDCGALKMAENVLRRAGKDEVADALRESCGERPDEELRRDAELLDKAVAALKPFAEIGAWLFARSLPDETPMVEIGLINGAKTALTRGDFKSAHLAAIAAEKQEES